MNIQERLRTLMNERDWTEYKLSKESNLSQGTIANIFRRNNAPTFATLESICKAFGITLAQFFEDGGNPVTLTTDQRELLTKWSTLTEEQRRLLLLLMDTM